MSKMSIEIKPDCKKVKIKENQTYYREYLKVNIHLKKQIVNAQNLKKKKIQCIIIKS